MIFHTGNGICVDYEKCQCNNSWIGSSCETPTCYDVNNCSLNGLCVFPNKCECFEQFDGENCTEKVAVNLNTPIFLNGSYFALVSENQAKGFVILTVSANDSDQGRSGQISYSIDEASIANFFMISQDSGEITVAADGVLDYESIPQKQFTFTVAATDNGIPTRNSEVTVTIAVKDENDNCPVFETLPGNYKIPVEILANDDDHGDNGQIKYSITEESDPDQKFYITSNGTLLANSVLQPGAYLLTIVAEDGGDIPCARELSLTVVVDEIVLPTSTSISTGASSTMSSTITLEPSSSLKSSTIALELSTSLQTITLSHTSLLHQSDTIDTGTTNTTLLEPTETGSTGGLISSTQAIAINHIVLLRMRLLSIGFVENYRNKSSMDYKTLREMVVSTLVKIFEKMEGFLRISDVDFEKGSVIANIKTEFSSENTQVSTSTLARTVVNASDENGMLGKLHFDTVFLHQQITPTTPTTTEGSDDDDDDAIIGLAVCIGSAAFICLIPALCLVSINGGLIPLFNKYISFCRAYVL